ncbi:MAG: ATP-binding protein [Thermodesulfobacteriota bacterium]
MKLWVKIVSLNFLIVVSLGVLIGLAVKNLVADTMKDELLKGGESLAKNLANIIADYVLLHDRYKIEEAIEAVIKTERDIAYVFITDTDGHLLAHSFKNGYPVDLLHWNPISQNNFSIQLLNTELGHIRDFGIRIFEGMESELHIGIKQERIKQTLIRLRNTVITLTIVGVIIGSALSGGLGKLITKPLYRLVDFTHHLSRGHFGEVLKINSKDEIGELAKTFNSLSKELKLYRERMEESYKKMLRTEKLTALGRISAGFAHELRNPLTSIKVLFQAFKNNPRLTKEDMEVILSEVERMENLLTRFLKFARINEVNFSEVYLNSIIKQLLNLAKFHIKDQKIVTELKLSKLPPLKADKALLEQVLLNIILNAIEAMPDGGKLSIASGLDNGYAFISISDTGGGIPENIKNKIFDPFFTTKPDGTGLGLSIAYNIVTLHNGEINFENNGQGTTFKVRIPLNI